jgi:hypothetical protein
MCHTLTCIDPPSVEPFPPNGFLQVKLGEEVRMSCKGSGVPYPIITWTTKVYFKKVLLFSFLNYLFKGEEIKLLNHRELLKFTASDRQMAGIYECKAVNGVGEPATDQIELNIICKKS